MDARLGLDPALYAPARLAQVDPERLISSHLQLVRRIAWHVHARVSSAIDVEDLVQIGMIALIEAASAEEARAAENVRAQQKSTWNRSSVNLRGGITPGFGQWKATFRDGLN